MTNLYLSSKIVLTPDKARSLPYGWVMPLDEIAHEIISLFVDGREKEGAIKTLAEKYSLTSKEIQDIDAFIDRLTAERILIPTKVDPRNATVNWDLTKKCNLRCKHCFADTTKTTSKELSTERILVLLRALRCHDFEKITFSGGEIFTRQDIWQILTEASRLSFEMILMSNGVLIGEKEAERLCELRPAWVRLSLDGGNPKINDRIRGKGTFAKIVRAVELLEAHNLRVGLTMTVIDQNRQEIDEFVELAEKIGVQQIGIGKVLPRGRAKTNNLSLSFSDLEFNLMVKKIADKMRGKIHIPNPIDDRQQYYYATKDSEVIPYCPEFYYALTINTQGYVLPCRGHDSHEKIPREEISTGNLQEEELATVLEKRRGSLHPSLDDFVECRACRYKYICTQNCLLALFAGNKKPGWRPSQDPECRAFLEEIRVTKELGYFHD